jgi:hypothetical protein
MIDVVEVLSSNQQERIQIFAVGCQAANGFNIKKAADV